MSGEIRARTRAGTGIPVDRISPEELSNAVLLVLKDGHCFDRPTLINYVRAVFGFDRTGEKAKKAIEDSIRSLLQEEVIGEGSLGIGLRG